MAVRKSVACLRSTFCYKTRVRQLSGLFIIGASLLLSGCATPPRESSATHAHYQLTALHTWRLNSPGNERFDASGLLLTRNGQLLTVSDRGPTLYQITPDPEASTADVRSWREGIPDSRFAPFAPAKSGRLDIEGLTEDAEGRIYLCEEDSRSILSLDLGSRQIRRLDIDWSPVRKYFSTDDRNASFEGVAAGDGKLFVANERQQGRIIVVDLNTLKIVDHFAPSSSVGSLWGPQYSDLAWFRGELYVLMREDHVVLRVNPHSHEVLAEYDFRHLELAPENEYRRTYWFTGVMEGLAVDADNIWLVTDNNGLGRKLDPSDSRPTLFQCRRPDSRPP